MHQLSIIGLGWLGLPLYLELTKLGYLCNGTTTNIHKKEQLIAEGVSCTVLKLQESEIVGNPISCLKNTDTLILNTPPGLRKNPDSNYVGKIEQLLPLIEKFKIKKVLFISSTSVFKDTHEFRKIENHTLPTATSNVANQLIKVENLLQENPNFSTTILRFSGLVDADRHPARMMSKRPEVNNALAPVNLIHRKDCINLITEIIKQGQWGKTFNASYPYHVSKKEYYTNICDKLGLQPPNFINDQDSKGKYVDGKGTAEVLNTKYKYVI